MKVDIVTVGVMPVINASLLLSTSGPGPLQVEVRLDPAQKIKL